ncbi:hypothetical protein HY572_05270 [Candidatus Micrarchaeota archaeon]|nr:hypothetical protein [Candidatus Micrarchaeota archaeon]
MKAPLAFIVLAVLSAFLAGCLGAFEGKPLPQDKKALAGCWVSEDATVDILISVTGSGKYRSPTVSITGPITVDGDVISFNVLGIKKDLPVDRMPFSEGGQRTVFVSNGLPFYQYDCTEFPEDSKS